MSDINELIHTTSVHAYNNGVKEERARIRVLLGDLGMLLEKEVSDSDSYSLGKHDAVCEVIALLESKTN
jgi:hypothetical protein